MATPQAPTGASAPTRLVLRNKKSGELLYVGSKVLDLSRRYALTWKGDPKGDPATVWRIEPTDAKARGDGVIRVRICNEQRGEYLYVGSKLLDPDRRLALTWVGDANDDEAMLWDIVPAPGGQNAREGVSFPPICRIRNAATDEYLYVGSSMLDAARRYALTWVGEANSDPAMVWEFVNPPSTAKAAPSAATTDASTHMSKPSPSKDSKKSESPSVPALPPPTPLPVGAAAKRKSRPTCTFLPEVKNSQALRSLHTGPTPTSNWVVPGRLIASENPTFYENEPTAASNIKRIVGAGARVFVCLHKHRISARSSYMRSAWALLSPQERGSLEFVSFPIGDMQTRTDKELDSFTDRIANSILTRPKLVHFVHCTGGHGRTGTVVSVVLGKLYPTMSADEAMMRVQLYHDCRKDYREEGYTTHSPETSEQRRQIRAALEMFQKRGCKIADKRPPQI